MVCASRFCPVGSNSTLPRLGGAAGKPKDGAVLAAEIDGRLLWRRDAGGEVIVYHLRVHSRGNELRQQMPNLTKSLGTSGAKPTNATLSRRFSTMNTHPLDPAAGDPSSFARA